MVDCAELFQSPPLPAHGSWRRYADAEQSLLELQPEEFAVGDPQRCAAGPAQVRREQRLSALPGARASLKFPNIVIVCTCIEISNHVYAGSDGHSSVHKRRTSWDT